MKNWMIKHKISILLSVIGAIAGYLYWNYVGCKSGSCAITSVWWRSTLYGMLMGWLLGGIINEQLNKKIKQNED